MTSTPELPTLPTADRLLLPLPAVLLSAMFLGDKPSLPVALTLVPIIGGVVLASTSELSFTWKGFLSGEASDQALIFTN